MGQHPADAKITTNQIIATNLVFYEVNLLLPQLEDGILVRLDRLADGEPGQRRDDLFFKCQFEMRSLFITLRSIFKWHS